ncbi:MCE family protein [Aeromicrobium sp.]|uniref:MCE family protein n=1 Tax=Aeromicrobium sp. TaxID=1871063 RepID=UPI003C3ECAFD
MRGLRTTTAIFVAFGLGALLVLGVLANTMTNQVSGGTSAFTADFTNASGLRPGDDVRAAGVKVGRVQGVTLHQGLARVRFDLAKKQPIYADTHLSVRYQNLLGQRYLAMLPGPESSRRLGAEAHVPASRTDPGFDLTALLNGFEPLFATLEPEQINELSSSIIAVMQGQGGTVESLLTETSALTNHLADKDAVLGRVLDNLVPVLRDLAARGDQLDQTVGDLRALMTSLAKERKSIGGSIDGISELSDATASLVSEARPPLKHDVRTLREFGRISVKELDRITSLFEVLPGATDSFSRPMSHGTWLNMYICNMGVDVGNGEINVGSKTGPYSEACR